VDEILRIRRNDLYIEVAPDNTEAMKLVKSYIEHLIGEQKEKSREE